ncbi:substrate-binding domain-containing protein [Cohnella sp. GCM10012308]|uniref:GntR family transcriptional regulator n=1 Tax=Cohnella sp. GCM10012308 TaxID=3317329 RepID=UPI003612CDB5
MSKEKEVPQYQVIIDYFLKKLNDGELKPGDRIPIDAEMVKMFNVSRITVTRAIKELEHKGFIYRLKKRGSFIREKESWNNGAVNWPAREASIGTMPIISVVLPFNEQIGYDILRGVEHICESEGLYVTFHNSNYNAAKEKEIIERLTNDGVHGIIIYPCSSEQNIDVFSKLMIDNYSFVIIDRNIEGLDTPLVVSDNFQGVYDLVSHLISLKHQRIAFVSSPIKQSASVMERYKGYCRALIDGGIPLNQSLVSDDLIDFTILPLEQPDLVMDSANHILEQLMALEPRPTAIVSVNDMTAMYLIKAALQMGIAVPDELSVTGFDNLSFSEHLDVPLTTVEQSFFAIGEQAALLMLKKRAEPEDQIVKKTLPTKLIIRQSSSIPISQLNV